VLAKWRTLLAVKGDISLLIAGAVLVFPKLALGLSGFETGVSVMPLIEGARRIGSTKIRHGSGGR
jgi:hypothetical protein